MLDASHGGAIELGEGSDALNNESRIVWNIDLLPNAPLELQYTYEYYDR